MRDYLDLAPTPIDEPCAMVEKTGDYMPRMRAECRAFVGQLERTFPEALEAGREIALQLINGHSHSLRGAVGLLYSIVKELDIQPSEVTQ